MKNTGALLKSKRESSSLSLSEVALATKINPKILAAIENGDESNLPAKTFLKGFVRSYALFLKMDVDTVMRSFQEETGGPPPAPVVAEPAKPAKSSKGESAPKSRRVDEESSSGLRTVAVVVIVVLIGLIIGVRELIEKYQRERVVEASADLNKATPVVTPVTEPAKTADTAPPAAATAAPAPDVAPDTGDEVVVDSGTVPKAAETVKPVETVKAPAPPKADEVKPAEPEKKEEPKTAANPPPRPAILSPRMNLVQVPINNMVEIRPNELSPPRPVETKPAEPKPAAAEAPKAEAPKAEAAKPEAAKPEETKTAEAPKENPPAADVKTAAKNEIILEALDKVEVKFQVKGETKRVSLGPTQVHTIHAELPMTLDLSDGGAVNIILNGRERGVPGDLGKPKTIRIP
jgi:cytoskeleton protein RodZ